jgi:hypothetical protein
MFAASMINYADNMSDIESAFRQFFSDDRAKTGDTFDGAAPGYTSTSTSSGKTKKAYKTGKPDSEGYIDNRDGTITDTKQGLMWLKHGHYDSKITWKTALSSIESLNSGSRDSDTITVKYNDWQMPSLIQLKRLGLPEPKSGVYMPAYFGTFRHTIWSKNRTSDGNGNDLIACVLFKEPNGGVAWLNPKKRLAYDQAVRKA